MLSKNQLSMGELPFPSHLVSRQDHEEVGSWHSVVVDGGTKEVVLEALQRLAWLQLPQKVGSVLDICSLSIF